VGTRQRKIGPEEWTIGPQAVIATCGPFLAKEVRTMDERSSWMRVAISIAIDWRFVMALVVFVLVLLLK
jgi:hypothetical protein